VQWIEGRGIVDAFLNKKTKPLGFFQQNGKPPSVFFESKENKAKSHGDSKKKGVQKVRKIFGRPEYKPGLNAHD